MDNEQSRWWGRRARLITAVGVLFLALGGLGLGAAAAQEADPAGSAGRQCGMVAYDWDGPVTTADRGFPREQPPRNNFNWRGGPNYAAGTLYYRAIIRSQPRAQAMRLQLCFWQPVTPGADYKFGLENCGPQQNILGEAGATAEWQVAVGDMWKKNDKDIDWTRGRYRTAVAVKNSSGQPVSNYNGWNWNGENAQQWYPLNMRFTAVVVPPGGEFCGWNYYDNPSAVGLAGLGAGPGSALLPLLLSAAGLLLLLSLWALRRARGGPVGS